MRVPFPVKVFVSYVVVVAAGALPTWFYLSDAFEVQLSRSFTRDAASRARLLAVMVEETPEAQRTQRLRELSGLFIERLTWILPSGQVVFDSSVTSLAELDDHSTREELQRARGTLEPSGLLEQRLPGVGAARRRSTSTGQDTLYVAVALADGGAVRLAVPITRVGELSTRVLGAFRNSVALSITVAIFLSLLAALVFSRPLRRMAGRAKQIAHGEYDGTPLRRTADELGDVAAALAQMAEELSSREAIAEAAIDMLGQVVRAASSPLVLLDPDDHLLAASPVAFDWTTKGATLGEVLGDWTESPEYLEARERARTEFEARHVLLGGQRLRLTPIASPSGPPLTLLNIEPTLKKARTIPTPDAVTVVPAQELLGRIWDRGPADVAGVQLVEVGGRVQTALAHLKRALPDARPVIAVEGQALHLTLDGFMVADETATVAHLLHPIGGHASHNESFVHVRLATA